MEFMWPTGGTPLPNNYRRTPKKETHKHLRGPRRHTNSAAATTSNADSALSSETSGTAAPGHRRAASVDSAGGSGSGSAGLSGSSLSAPPARDRLEDHQKSPPPEQRRAHAYPIHLATLSAATAASGSSAAFAPFIHSSRPKTRSGKGRTGAGSGAAETGAGDSKPKRPSSVPGTPSVSDSGPGSGAGDSPYPWWKVSSSNDKHQTITPRNQLQISASGSQSESKLLTTKSSNVTSTNKPVPAHPDRRPQHVTMLPDPRAFQQPPVPYNPRSESLSSNSAATFTSSRTIGSADPPSTADGGVPKRPFVVRNGRTYLSDPGVTYPLPVDLTELHRQSLRTLLLFQLFGGPVCSPVFANKPPTKVLEVGCGVGFWSMMCHRYYARHGHSSISFTGVDIAAIGTVGPEKPAAMSAHRPDKDMNWKFVQHDIRLTPWPFADGEFDLVFCKDLSLAVPTTSQQAVMDEYLRMLRPGGALELWESDHTVRMLRPHVPESNAQVDDEDENEAAADLGAYVMTGHTPLSAPLDNYLVEYNGWLIKALEARSLSPVPCTLIGPMLLQEADVLSGIGSRRLAIPLSEVRWEREGVGGVVTKDGKSYIDTAGKGKKTAGESVGATPGAVASSEQSRRTLTAGQTALRRTALFTVVQMIQSMEPILREVSGKSQDEWDAWQGKMMNDLMKENGTSWGECLEVGAWWAKKKKR